jgi:hypothetical protein
MTLVGVDLHSREQSVAMLDTATGEVEERRIRHEGNNVTSDFTVASSAQY